MDIWLSNVQNKVVEHLVALKAEIEVDVIIVVKLGIWHELVPVVVEVAEVVSVVVTVAAANPATTVKKLGIYLETVQKNDQVVAAILQAVPVTTVVDQGICLESALIEAAGAVAEEEPLKLATDVVLKDTLQEIVRRKEAVVAANQAEEILNVTGVGALVTWPVIVLQKMNRLPYAHLKVSIVVMLCARRNFT